MVNNPNEGLDMGCGAIVGAFLVIVLLFVLGVNPDAIRKDSFKLAFSQFGYSKVECNEFTYSNGSSTYIYTTASGDGGKIIHIDSGFKCEDLK